MLIKNTLLVLSLTALAAPLAADNPATTSAPTSKPDKGADRVICRTQEEIGSRLRKKKICMTAAQWRDVGFQSGQAAEKTEIRVSKPGGG